MTDHDPSPCDGRPIYFPARLEKQKEEGDDDHKDHGSDDNDDTETFPINTFEEVCRLAAEGKRPLHLYESVTLREVIVLRGRQRLTLCGPQEFDFDDCGDKHQQQVNTPIDRVTITGRLHSLFLLNNHSRLAITGINLHHQEPLQAQNDCRKVGAAVNLRYKSHATLYDSTIRSDVGFCGWAVQKATLEMTKCTLRAPLRSALVCFGQSHLTVRRCHVVEAGVHGVCARGACNLSLKDTTIVDSTVRALYAYARAVVVLDQCVVQGTQRTDSAAIELVASEITEAQATEDKGYRGVTGGKRSLKNIAVSSSTTSLVMTSCQVIDNAGVGVRLRGPVHSNIILEEPSCGDNLLERNAGGNVDVRPSGAMDDNVLNDNDDNNGNDTTLDRPRRDASGSSFRLGDWVCPSCMKPRPHIVPGSRDTCPLCNTDKSHECRFLTSVECRSLNQGGTVNLAGREN